LRIRRSAALLLFLAVAGAPFPIAAYQRHLSEDDVREAFLFGQRHDLRVAQFFNAYEKQITYSGALSDARVRAIGVRTPYSAAVLRSYQAGNVYSEAQAWKDHQARARVFEVVVWIDFPLNGGPIAPNVADPAAALLRLFTVRLFQQSEIAAQKSLAVVQSQGDSPYPAVGELHFEYDVRRVASATARIEVMNQSGEKTFVEFDLADLR
jgi:hypothetical protein